MLFAPGHKEVDGLREAELSGNKIGTTKRGIGPAYASKATRNGVRGGDVRDPESSPPGAARSPGRQRFDFEYDVEAEIENYKVFAEKVKPYIQDTVALVTRRTKPWTASSSRRPTGRCSTSTLARTRS